MSDHVVLLRQLLVEILSIGSQPAARLKQSLMRQFETRAGRRFDDIPWNVSKFSDLLYANQDLLELIRPQGPGDIQVRLRPDKVAGAVAPPPPDVVVADAQRAPWIPSNLWQAFTNPDPLRRRFFHRTRHTIVHYVESADRDLDRQIKKEVLADPGFVEIEYVPAEKHLAWMREYLGSVALPDRMREVFDRLLQGDYSSSLNYAFTQALGPQHEGGWRRFRALKINRAIEEWAEKNSVDFKPNSGQQTQQTGVASTPAERSEREIRVHLHALIDSLQGDELDNLQLTLSASSLARILSKKSEG